MDVDYFFREVAVNYPERVSFLHTNFPIPTIHSPSIFRKVKNLLCLIFPSFFFSEEEVNWMTNDPYYIFS
mgnify:CR=1 FL=1